MSLVSSRPMDCKNDVHIDIVLAQQVKDLERNAGVVAAGPNQGHAGDAGVLRDAGNGCLFHFGDLLHFRSGLALPELESDLQIHP